MSVFDGLRDGKCVQSVGFVARGKDGPRPRGIFGGARG